MWSGTVMCGLAQSNGRPLQEHQPQRVGAAVRGPDLEYAVAVRIGIGSPKYSRKEPSIVGDDAICVGVEPSIGWRDRCCSVLPWTSLPRTSARAAALSPAWRQGHGPIACEGERAPRRGGMHHWPRR